ncbi:hypothetical protein BT93_L3013 [Corymbia citriodora subsp. variegata]|uniref:Uncharacterized protein n=1 Tax=Corymbia citriodora subsp. variegata TaxID=360336 RepID=A0A8T0CI76_CORYI|nr:hypothetical protein BT93_L3013 [Corymbia citriodora subsp. variegata]
MLLRSIRASLPTVARRFSAEAATAAAEIPEAAFTSAAVGTAEVPVEASVSPATGKAPDGPATKIASASTAAKASEGAAIRQGDDGGRAAAETQLRRTISMLRKFKRYERALEVCALRSECSRSRL